MSFICLLEQGEEYSAECFSDIPACVLSRLNLIRVESCSSDNATVSCQNSPSGTTCELSTASRGADLSMSCVADSHAKIFPVQGAVLDLKENEADCGPKCEGSLAKYNPKSCSWRTRQCSLFGGLEEFSETWPRFGMMLDGECFPLETLEHDTDVKESGSIPTPTKMDSKRHPVKLKYALTKTDYDDLSTFIARQTGFDVTYLNADFWEHAMGWPIQWAELQPLAMDKFQQWLRLHGEFSARTNKP